MLVTEEEANAKTCPYKTKIKVPSGMWAFSPTINIGTCNGSQCMMWRWTIKLDNEGNQYGYCGLAGEPK